MALDFNAVLAGDHGSLIVKGITVSLELAVGAWIMAMCIAIVLVIIRLSHSRLANATVAAYVSYHRNVPTLIQLMIWYFAIPTLLPSSWQDALNSYDTEFIFSLIALGCCQGAYFSEDIRSGLRAIPAGQTEAARAMGMGYLQAMCWVILPQAMRNALSSLINHTVLLFKNTSLAMVIGVAELTYVTRDIENETFRTFESYLVASSGYLAFSLILMGIGALLARRFQRVYQR
ncbi:amino acid ABC transporter permease [Tatumella ptyseos]|uniref:amino acid ABC transporter permease n=1 Tax=Tatumella ptyseos TaxID=82987 RepID=UPI0026E9C237|nr:amino acid ABC transporter permease [Tatumella ptyseos]WKX26989.1 amino acid ABC transporter permease [Tatumella ptyseos]